MTKLEKENSEQETSKKEQVWKGTNKLSFFIMYVTYIVKKDNFEKEKSKNDDSEKENPKNENSEQEESEKEKQRKGQF